MCNGADLDGLTSLDSKCYGGGKGGNPDQGWRIASAVLAGVLILTLVVISALG